jgi:hypothetical protein
VSARAAYRMRLPPPSWFESTQLYQPDHARSHARNVRPGSGIFGSVNKLVGRDRV